MKILNRQPFSSSVHLMPGDTLIVTWNRDGKQISQMQATIEEEQTLDHAVLVEYDPDEAEELGFKSALGVFAGENLIPFMLY